MTKEFALPPPLVQVQSKHILKNPDPVHGCRFCIYYPRLLVNNNELQDFCSVRLLRLLAPTKAQP